MKPFVAFDLDGTIVDSRQAIVGCFQHSLQVHGCDPVPDEAIAGHIGLPLARMLDGLAPVDKIDACIATYSEAFAEWDRRYTLPFDGMIDLIRRLRSEGHPTAVTSSKSRRGIVRVVAEQGIDDLFDALWGGDSVTHGKPHPEMLQRAMAGVGVEPSESVIVGDTTFDIEMGVAAGVRALGVAWGMHGADRLTQVGADAVAESADQLWDLIRA